MRRWIWVMTGLFSLSLQAQKKWDGGAGTNQWNDALNWMPDGVPSATDDVILDNSIVQVTYTVSLPPGAVTVNVRSITIHPYGAAIVLELPSTNMGNPGLDLTGVGESLIIHEGAVFRNASGATAGSGLALAGSLVIRNGGRYVHQTPRSNAGIIDKLLIEPGTEKGIFEFDVPGTAGYTVSLTGNNFGSLYFSASGGAKSYSGSGSGTLTVRGDMVVGLGAQVTSTLTADIMVAGSLTVEGRLSLNPSTSGAVARSLRLTGSGVRLAGSGQLLFNGNFRNIEIAGLAEVELQRDLVLSQSTHSVICRGTLTLNDQLVSGPGSFLLADSGRLVISNSSGIPADPLQGNIQTVSRSLSSRGNYFFNGSAPQQTGDGLPDSVSSLGINNPNGLSLSKTVFVRDSLLLHSGRILSDPASLLTVGNLQWRSGPNRYGNTDEGNEQSFIEGTLRIHLHPEQQMVAPVGADTIFAPVRVKWKNPNPGSVMVRYVPLSPPERSAPGLLWLSDREHWQLDQEATSSLVVQVSARPWSFPGDPQGKPVIGIKTAATNWLPAASIMEPGSYRWLRSDTIAAGITHLAPATVLDPALLPLQLLSFTARDEQGGILLSWEAEEDGGQVRYRIMRSGDGLDFSEIGSVASAGSGRIRHFLKDPLPLPVNFYQLLADENGRETRSRVIRRTREQPSVRIWPNPVREELNIFFSGPRSINEIEVVSLNGTVCKTFVCNTATYRLRVDDLKKGFYFIRLRDRIGSITLPFTKD